MPKSFATIDWFDRFLDKLTAVTADDVQQAARKLLAKRNRTVGFYLPGGTDPKSAPSAG